jgi:hypothetical protein
MFAVSHFAAQRRSCATRAALFHAVLAQELQRMFLTQPKQKRFLTIEEEDL